MLKASSTTKLLKNLLLSIHMAKDNKSNFGNSSNYEDKTIKKSLLLKNLNGTINYLTFNTKQAFI